MPIPFNRIVAFVGPYISLLAGAIATWLVAKSNALGIQGLEQSDLAQQIGATLTFTLTATLTWLGQAQWLKGHHLQLEGDTQVQAAALAVPPPPELDLPRDPEHEALMALSDNLPDDEEEFSTLPDQESRFAPEVPA